MRRAPSNATRTDHHFRSHLSFRVCSNAAVLHRQSLTVHHMIRRMLLFESMDHLLCFIKAAGSTETINLNRTGQKREVAWLHVTSERVCDCNDRSRTMVVKIRSVLFAVSLKMLRPCSTSPPCEQALSTQMTAASLISSLGVRRKSSIASSPIPFSPYELTNDDQRDSHQTDSR